MCGSSGSAATVRVLALALAQTQTQHRLQFSLDRPPPPRPFARRQPVRHNEHHCVLSAFVVSCSCEPPSLPAPAPAHPPLLWPGGLFIYSFSCPCLSPSTFLALVCHVFPLAVLSRCLSNFCSAFWLGKKVASDSSSRPGASSCYSFSCSSFSGHLFLWPAQPVSLARRQ